jgi:lambda family phage portal protein
MPIMFPGESIQTVSATRPNSNFDGFEAACLRNIASGLGLSAQQLSNNWSDVNYSSARAALLESWKTLTRRRMDFSNGFASQIYCNFLEEATDIEDLPLPKGAPEFWEARSSYARCKWIGPGRGWIDPVAEKQGAVLGMDAGLSTLEEECAEQGVDWEEVLDQRAKEVSRFKELGLELPKWAGEDAKQSIKKPEAE